MAHCPPTRERSSVRTVAALAVLGLWAPGAGAQTAPVALTVSQAERLALARNTDFRVAEAQVDAALAQLKTVREYPNPTLGVSTAKISTDGTPESTALGNGLLERSYDTIVSLSQLFVVGKRGLMRDAAKAGVDSAEFQREDARRLLLQSVVQTYAAAVAAVQQANVLEDSAAKLRREAAIAKERLKVGDLSSSDEAQLEIAADQDGLNADAARAAAQTAVVTLEILLGEPAPAGTTRLSDTLDTWLASVDPNLESASVASRPDIAAAEKGAAQADATVRLQERLKLPDITASVQFERNPPAQPDTVGVGISIPLPIWDQFDGEVRAAKAAREQSQAQLDKVRIEAAASVTSARVAYHEASQRFLRYRSTLVPKSAEVARSVSYAYEKGGASLVDLLEAERNDNLIRVAAVQAQADTASAAAALQAALGRLTSPAEIEPNRNPVP